MQCRHLLSWTLQTSIHHEGGRRRTIQDTHFHQWVVLPSFSNGSRYNLILSILDRLANTAPSFANCFNLFTWNTGRGFESKNTVHCLSSLWFSRAYWAVYVESFQVLFFTDIGSTKSFVNCYRYFPGTVPTRRWRRWSWGKSNLRPVHRKKGKHICEPNLFPIDCVDHKNFLFSSRIKNCTRWFIFFLKFLAL